MEVLGATAVISGKVPPAGTTADVVHPAELVQVHPAPVAVVPPGNATCTVPELAAAAA